MERRSLFFRFRLRAADTREPIGWASDRPIGEHRWTLARYPQMSLSPPLMLVIPPTIQRPTRNPMAAFSSSLVTMA